MINPLAKRAASVIFAGWLAHGVTAQAAQPNIADNPYSAPTGSPTNELLRSAIFGMPGSDAAIEAQLKDHPLAEVQRALFLDRLCGDYYARSAYQAMVTACTGAAALGVDESKPLGIGTALQNVAPVRSIGSTTLQLKKNALGSRDAIVTANGVSAPWLVDTGAQISVISQSLAQKMHLTPLEKSVAVGSTTGDVDGHLAVIPVIQIGDAMVENVAVLIEPDEQLKIADLAQIQGVLGLPVLIAFRRVAWLNRGDALALGETAPPVPNTSPRIYWHDEGVGMPVSTPLGNEGAHLDTGANEGYLWTPAHQLLDAETESKATDHVGKLGGSAGVIETKEKVYPTIRLDVAGIPVSFPGMTLTEREGKGAGRLGDDLVQQLDLLDLDFENMRVLATAAR